MALYTIGDLHLSLGSDKPMDIFSGWQGYMQRLEDNWRSTIAPTDTVIVPGDISWAMSLETAQTDFCFLHSLPGEKILLKGNHDYWWTTMNKMTNFLSQNGLNSIKILHNSSVQVEDKIICGTRGWLFEAAETFDSKIVTREAARLEASLKSAEGLAGEKLVFLHYPPVFGEQVIPQLIDLMLAHGVKRCYYGHIHGTGVGYAFNGNYCGIALQLVSSDFLSFAPLPIL